MVPTELQEIIHHYQEEQSLIKAEMDEALREGDYMAAHLHQQSLGKITQKLEVLNQRAHPYDDKVDRLESEIIRCKKMREPKGWYTLNPDEIEKHLLHLETRVKEVQALRDRPKTDGQVLFDQLKLLLKAEIAGLKLYLRKKDNLYLTFHKLGESKLIIKITPDNEIKGYSTSPNWRLEELEKVGFHNDSHQWSALFDLSEDPFFDSLFQCLSRLVFDVFRHISPDKDSTLEQL